MNEFFILRLVFVNLAARGTYHGVHRRLASTSRGNDRGGSLRGHGARAAHRTAGEFVRATAALHAAYVLLADAVFVRFFDITIDPVIDKRSTASFAWFAIAAPDAG